MSQYYERPVEFRVASVFSDYMVLQREKNIHIFGEGEEGTKVEVALVHCNGNQLWAKTIVEGQRWLAILPPQKAEEDCDLLIRAYKDGEKIYDHRFLYVSIGEVWLAGGQSNMEFELKDCESGQETLAKEKCPNVRFYYTPKEPYKNKQFYEAEEASGWEEYDAEKAKRWSAVGYYFARKLSRDLRGIAVGIIGCNWGGTSASAWMSKEALKEDAELSSYLKEYDAACDGLSIEEQEEAYDRFVEYHAEWDKKCGKLYEENPNIRWSEVEEKLGKCQWPGPMNIKNPFRPAGLYECMLQRVCPYSLRGFIYYQGESDDHKPHMYYKLFTRMIRQWREDFMDEEMPFLMTQLTMHRYQYDEDFKNWPIIREAQMDAYKTLKNTGIAVIIDCGEFNNIHPLNKRSVGERLELQALAQVYNRTKLKKVFGPIYKNCIYREKEIELCFDYADDGFEVRGGEQPTGFEVAGRDKKFVPATVRIEESRIYVSSPEVEEPLFARYLWTNYAKVTLFGANGFPVAPFRTSKRDEKCE